MDKKREGITDLLDAIAEHVPHPQANTENDFQMLITQTESTKYFGRHLIGRIHEGTIETG